MCTHAVARVPTIMWLVQYLWTNTDEALRPRSEVAEGTGFNRMRQKWQKEGMITQIQRWLQRILRWWRKTERWCPGTGNWILYSKSNLSSCISGKRAWIITVLIELWENGQSVLGLFSRCICWPRMGWGLCCHLHTAWSASATSAG